MVTHVIHVIKHQGLFEIQNLADLPNQLWGAGRLQLSYFETQADVPNLPNSVKIKNPLNISKFNI